MEDTVTFEVALMTGEDAESALLTRALARELEDAGAESVVSRRENALHPGTKSAFEWGKLAVQVATTGLPSLFAALAGWLARRPDEKVRIKWRDGDREVEVECSNSTLEGSRLDELANRVKGIAQPVRRPSKK
jgi:hypothetical protein